jgi:phosphoribosyl 1,2-cyclic phosphodiesterase
LGDKGHLSNVDSSYYLSKFIGDNTKCVILAHLSEHNNTEALALNTLIETLDNSNKKCDNVIVATQNERTELVEV